MTWKVQEAKAGLNALIRAAETAGPQTITRDGTPVAVVLSQREYEVLDRVARARSGSLLEFFRSCPVVLKVPPRNRQDVGRDIDL